MLRKQREAELVKLRGVVLSFWKASVDAVDPTAAAAAARAP